ncbi:MAG: putative metal-binding motif-containing protein [Myxococcales bacterium]|nr:putative metal-binding motif-containing protein [Myxococcales bacterium]
MQIRCLVAVGLIVSWMGCGREVVYPDAELDAPRDTNDGPCQNHDDCDDRRFCNGVERCDPEASSADARGCVPGAPPCSADRCDEADRRCDNACEDADGDGYPNVRCGGSDCDDANPLINPGAVEVCDPDHVDEDCNPLTFAGPEGDRDGDGFISSACCNLQPSGALLCGDDCNDDDRLINPAALELCDGIDNNCNGSIDEGCPCTPEGLEEVCDAERAGVGNCRAGMRICTADGWTGCIGSVTPTEEICNTLEEDEDCDGRVDEGCDCLSPLTRTCSTDVGRCVARQQTCRSNGTWPRACEEESGVVFPRTEMCNGMDDDCDGIIDNGVGCACTHGAGRECGTNVGRCTRGTQTCAMGSWTECTGIGSTDEVCNHVDDDCDGRIDEGVEVAACTFSQSGSAARTAFLPCEPNCGPTAPGTVIRRLGSSSDSTARALWLNSRGEPVDWGSSTFLVEARFRLTTTSNIAPTARSSVVISPNVGLGSDARHRLPVLPTGRVGFAAEAEINAFFQRVRLLRFTATEVQVVGESEIVMNSACVALRDENLQYTVTLRAANGGAMRASVRVHGRTGCNFTRYVDHTEVNWLNTLYGTETDVRTYEVGTIVHGVDMNGHHDLESILVSRSRTSSERGFCHRCPWRI